MRMLDVKTLKADLTLHEGHYMIMNCKGWYECHATVDGRELVIDTPPENHKEPDEASLFCADCGIYIDDDEWKD